jgi:hypothetical protein
MPNGMLNSGSAAPISGGFVRFTGTETIWPLVK